MEVFEITGFKTGISEEGVNFLQPSDSFQNIENGYIYRQVLQSRKGFNKFSFGWDDGGGLTGHLQYRVMGIFENVLTLTSTKELLVFDTNFAYKYDEGTNSFIRIPFGGSLAAFAGFGINNPEDYISGTTYPDKNGNNRFVFTSIGATKVFFYNGTNILDFTNADDNPDYVAFAGGALTNARHVIWFGERLNFISPTIAGALRPQAILYSGIKDSSGNGDNFNVAGSGLIEIDTYELIKGAKILGDKISLNVSRSNWIVEKTRDAFNPYFVKKTPSVLGTDASFSPVEWNDEVRLLGKTGIIATDSRNSLRVDTKIPYFTLDNIDQLEFEQCYGGFDRDTSQFMWTYVDTDNEEGAIADKVLVNNYEEGSFSIYDMRFSCFGQTIAGQNLTWDDIFEDNNASWETWDTTEETWDKIGIGKEVQKTLAGDDYGFIYQLNQDFEDYYFPIQGITQSNPAVINLPDHPFEVGDEVKIENVEGMTQINGQTVFVTARTTTTITVNVNSTNYDDWTDNGSVSKIIKFYAETIPFNPYRNQGKMVYISHIEFLLDSNEGNLLLDIFMDEEQTPFKKNILLNPNKITSGQVTDVDIINDPIIKITTDNTIGLRENDLVLFENVGGSTELNNNYYQIENLTSTTFEISQASVSAFTSGGTWRVDQPERKGRRWVTVTVNNQANFMRFAMKQNSVSDQIKITSIRIHAEMAGSTIS